MALLSQDRTSAPAADSGWVASDKVRLSLRLATAALVAVAGYVHLQEWNDGTLGGFLIARYASLFEYSEPAWRTSAVVSAVLEVGAIILASVAIAVGIRLRDPRL